MDVHMLMIHLTAVITLLSLASTITVNVAKYVFKYEQTTGLQNRVWPKLCPSSYFVGCTADTVLSPRKPNTVVRLVTPRSDVANSYLRTHALSQTLESRQEIASEHKTEDGKTALQLGIPSETEGNEEGDGAKSFDMEPTSGDGDDK